MVEVRDKTLNLIIVEDYKLTRFGLKATLNEFEGVSVVAESENAEDGLKLIEKLKPDVVLMDLGLPGMNGIEATQKIKEISPDTKIIVLTSHEREEEVISAMGSGANGYCLKDIDPQSLVNVIVSVGSGAAWIDPGVSKYILNLMPKPESTKILNSYEISDARAQLTERELEVLKLLVKGKSNTEIAKELIVSVHTAKAHVCSILQKLCVDDRVQAAVKAIKENII
ncbi:MAG: response regulator transcription factor [Candidatus Gastranaerophilales bacterium]|nr:response regulator transcription factor [Candidatus Gastranaerophilales bacterium]